MLLRDIDDKVRVRGVDVCTPQDAVDFLDALSDSYSE